LADCQSFNTIGNKMMMNKNGIYYVSNDGINWSEATKLDTEEWANRKEEYDRNVEEALKKEIDPTTKDGIRSIIKILEKDINRYTVMLNSLNGTSEEYPYRCFGIKTLEEAIAYLSDTIDSLKNVIKEEV